MPIINSEPRAKEIRSEYSIFIDFILKTLTISLLSLVTRSMGKALHIMGFSVRIQKPRKIRMRRATVGIAMHRDPSPEMHRDPSPETYRPRSSSLSCKRFVVSSMELLVTFPSILNSSIGLFLLIFLLVFCQALLLKMFGAFVASLITAH